MSVLLPVAPRPPFQAPEGYFCRYCKGYRPEAEFNPSFIQRRYRVCRSCNKKHRRKEPADPLRRLRRKLVALLHSRGHGAVARAMTVEDVGRILKANNVEVHEVVRVVPPRGDPAKFTDLNNYLVVKRIA
jgi:hypothetical protein